MIDAGWSPAVRRDLVSTGATGRRRLGAAQGLCRLAAHRTRPSFNSCQVLAEQWAALPDQDRPRFPLRRGSFHPELPEELPRRPPRMPARRSGRPSSTSAIAGAWPAWPPGTCPIPRARCSPPSCRPGTRPAPTRPPPLPPHPLSVDRRRRAPDPDPPGAASPGRPRCGLPRSAAGLPHYRAYATILEVLHWERVINESLRPGATPSGISSASSRKPSPRRSDITVDQVDKWRKAISACRRGRRHEVPAAEDRRPDRRRRPEPSAAGLDRPLRHTTGEARDTVPIFPIRDRTPIRRPLTIVMNRPPRRLMDSRSAEWPALGPPLTAGPHMEVPARDNAS